MRIAIVVDDNCVMIEGSPWPVNCNALRLRGISAIQCYDGPLVDDGWAEIEWKSGKENTKIFEGHPKHVDLWSEIAKLVRKWQEADAAQRVKEMETGE